MLIRTMNENDVEQAAEIESLCFSRPWSRQAFEDSLKQDAAVFLVLTEDEKVCGYIGMYISFEEGEITNVAVSPKMRGQGCGTRLVSAMKDYGKEHNLERIVLEVRPSNAAAIHVYEQSGFVSLGIRKGFYDLPKEDAIIMALTIDK